MGLVGFGVGGVGHLGVVSDGFVSGQWVGGRSRLDVVGGSTSGRVGLGWVWWTGRFRGGWV